jgi:site-specific recombinase XerD
MPGLSALIDDYLQMRLRCHEIEWLTARNDRCALRQFAVVCGDDLSGVTPAAGRAWLESLDGLAPATRRRRFSTVRTFCRWAMAEEILTVNPLARLRSPRQPRSIPRALPVDDVARTLRACPDARARLLVVWMVQLGLRCIELARVESGDVDRANGVVRIRGKGGHERILPIVAEALDALDAYLDEEPPRGAGPLVRSRLHPDRGLDADTISGLVAGWMWRAGVKRRRRDGISAHALRHTAATDMLRAGAHLRDVQHALGHAHLATTEVYLPHLVRGLDEAMNGRRYGPG